jgi:hypothetical protein
LRHALPKLIAAGRRRPPKTPEYAVESPTPHLLLPTPYSLCQTVLSPAGLRLRGLSPMSG